MNNSGETTIVTGETNKKRNNGNKRVPLFFSKPGTTPYNELTEEERINEGSRNPYIKPVNFQKDKKEKKYLKKLKSRSKNKIFAGSSSSLNGHAVPLTITVYLHNNRTFNPNRLDSNDKKHFPNVHTFKSTNPEFDALMLANSLHTTVSNIVINGKKTK